MRLNKILLWGAASVLTASAAMMLGAQGVPVATLERGLGPDVEVRPL